MQYSRPYIRRRDFNCVVQGPNGRRRDVVGGVAIDATLALVAEGIANAGRGALKAARAASGATKARGVATGAGSMSSAEVRLWYSTQVKALNVDVAATEANARLLWSQRNALKIQGRKMMTNRQAAMDLDITDPIQPFEYYVNKYSAQGYSGQGLWQRIIEGSKTPNQDVNSTFNIE